MDDGRACYTTGSVVSTCSYPQNEDSDRSLCDKATEWAFALSKRTEGSLLSACGTGAETVLSTSIDLGDDPGAVFRASLGWLRAYDRGLFQVVDRTISKARAKRAGIIAERLAVWKRHLLPETGYQEETLSSLLANDLDFRMLGGALAVQEEQIAWWHQITRSDSVDLFMEWFLYEQSMTGRQPCKNTDVVVRMLSNRLPPGSAHRKEVESLLSYKRNQVWQLLESEENVEGARI